jgi:mannose-1-phosphate guanylyltransferase
VRAIVLVGGEGTRLRPLTYHTPKQLLPVVEVPMLERVLAHLGRHGVDEAILSIGYRPDAFAAAYPDGVAAGVRLSYAVEPEPLDTAGAIRFAADHAGIDDMFIVVNGDVLTDLDVGALVAFHRRHGAEATINLTAVEDPSRFGVVPTDDEGKVIAFVEKPPAGEAPTNLINAGTYVLEPSVLGRIPTGRRVSIERETFPALAADGSLYASASDSYWLDTGTPAAYLQAHADLLDGTRPGPPAPGAMALAEGVWTLDEPRIEGAVGPPSLVGAGAVVVAGATLRASVLGAHSVLEAGAQLVDSVVLPGAVLCEGASVTGSVVGPGAVVGAGSVVEPLTVIGHGVELAPGTKVADARIPAQVPG